MSAAKAHTSAPSLIRMHSVIAWPAPKAQGTAKSHGSALGDAEIAETKKILGLNPDENFAMPTALLDHVRQVKNRGAAIRGEWDAQFANWSAKNPDKVQLLARLRSRKLPAGWEEAIPTFEAGKEIATRKASGDVIQGIASVLPEFWGGSADLAESNNTTIEGSSSFLPATSAMKNTNPYGRVIHFGIREHAMGSILNGISLHGLTRTFGGTFAVFSDYMRPAVRLASLMGVPSIFVWTHDSIGLGEDGPTHQPVEHFAALRAIPGLAVIRPADANEVAQAWKSILKRDVPAGILLSRQNLPVIDRATHGDAAGVDKGAYILKDSQNPVAIIIATGSEVSIALEAQKVLTEKNISVRVVSAPCIEWFNEQPRTYRDEVLPPSITNRVSVEAGIAQGWRDLVGDNGTSISLEHYGASASASVLFKEFGFTSEAIVDAVIAGTK